MATYSFTSETSITGLKGIKPCKLDTNKYIVVDVVSNVATFHLMSYSSGSISKTDLTGTISSVSNVLGIAKLTTSSFAVLYSSSSNNYAYIKVCTLSGSALTWGSAIYFGSSGTAPYSGSIISLSSTKIVAGIGIMQNSNGYMVCATISGTTLTKGPVKSTGWIAYDKINGITMSDSSFVFKSDEYSNGYSMLIAGTVSGTTITLGKQINITYSGGSGTGKYSTACYLAENKIFATYINSGEVYGYGYIRFSIYTLSGTTLTKQKDTDYSTSGRYSAYSTDCCYVSDNEVLLTAVKRNESVATLLKVTVSTYTSTLTVLDDFGTSTLYNIDSIGTGIYALVAEGKTLVAYIPVVAPTVTTQAATNIAQTSCTGNGNITATGGANATRRGFCYKAGTSGDPTTSDSVVYDDGSFGTGAFNKSITGLTPNTSYRVRAYAVNSAGTSYGTTVSVTTLSSFIPRTMWFN